MCHTGLECVERDADTGPRASPRHRTFVGCIGRCRDAVLCSPAFRLAADALGLSRHRDLNGQRRDADRMGAGAASSAEPKTLNTIFAGSWSEVRQFMVVKDGGAQDCSSDF